MGPSALNVQVPRGASLEVDVVSAPLSIDGLDGGAIEVNSVSGKVRINAKTPSLAGRQRQRQHRAGRHARVRPSCRRSAATSWPRRWATKPNLETVSGRVQAHGGPWRKFTLSTVSGDVDVTGGLTDDGKLDIDSMSGDVQLTLPADVSTAIHASSFSGDLRSAFGTPERTNTARAANSDVARVSGSARISIESFSGDVRIRKQGD